jgi:phosphohistidine phosphatase
LKFLDKNNALLHADGRILFQPADSTHIFIAHGNIKKLSLADSAGSMPTGPYCIAIKPYIEANSVHPMVILSPDSQVNMQSRHSHSYMHGSKENVMKYLYILRHGIAGTPSNGNDYERELTARGLLDISILATKLAEQNTRIDLIISSAAPRALQTAWNIAKILNYPEDGIIERKGLYLASAGKLMSTVNKLDNSHTRVMIVGHNPGISELGLLLALETPYLPPGGLLCVKLCVNSWNQVTMRCGVTEYEEFPESFRNI